MMLQRRQIVRGPLGLVLVLTTVCLGHGLGSTPPAWAGPASQVAEETAELLIRQFGREASEEGVETLVARIERIAAQHGDDAVTAVRRGGPKGLRAIEQAGADAPAVVRLLQRRGDEALWVLDDAARRAHYLRLGDEAADALIKHKGVADPLIAQFDRPAVEALGALSTGQNARRLAMLAEQGDLTRIGRTSDLLAVVGRYGDRAMDFIWRNKIALGTAAALVAFLNDPEPFLEGAKDLATVTAQQVVQPAVDTIATEVATRTDWTWLLGVVVLAGTGLLAVRMVVYRIFSRVRPAR